VTKVNYAKKRKSWSNFKAGGKYSYKDFLVDTIADSGRPDSEKALRGLTIGTLEDLFWEETDIQRPKFYYDAFIRFCKIKGISAYRLSHSVEPLKVAEEYADKRHMVDGEQKWPKVTELKIEVPSKTVRRQLVKKGK